MGPKTVQNPIPIIRAPIVASCSSRLTLTLNRRTRLRSDRILQKSASQVRLIFSEAFDSQATWRQAQEPAYPVNAFKKLRATDLSRLIVANCVRPS